MDDWLIGTKRGLYRGTPDGIWENCGGYTFRITGIARRQDQVYVSAGSGLWEVAFGGMWRQLHDETLTEVLDLALIDGDPGIVAASAYGLATAVRDDLGAARWTFWSDGLQLNARFSNAVLAMDDDRWLVGTEAGVLVATDGGRNWTHTSLGGGPVRALLGAHGAYWAGSDERGIWRSLDGVHWEQAGRGLDEATVFALAATHDGLIAGTLAGVAHGDGHGPWERQGPHVLMAAVGVDPASPQRWLAGADPGGLWCTQDAGRSWRQLAGVPGALEAILAPEAG